MDDVIHNLAHIRRRMSEACKKAGRQTDEVKLMLAAKTVPADRLRVAIEQGETLLGQNKVQEGISMSAQLAGLPVEWHFIGHLQTNKIKDVLKWATCVQSVDRTELVQKLDQRLQFEGKSLDILVQVNTSYEESKFGVAPDQALSLVNEIRKYDTLKVKGLMTIGLFSDDQEAVRRCFRSLKNLSNQLKDAGLDAPVLSMGMSGDLEAAIEEGTTMIRVGTAIFGQRIYPDSYYWNENKV